MTDRLPSGLILATALAACSAPTDPGATTSASAKPTAAESSVASAPSSPTSTASSARQATALEACLRVQASGIGTLCEEKPLVLGAISVAQLTFASSASQPGEYYAGFFTFDSPEAYEKALAVAKLGADAVDSRLPPTLIAQAPERLLVVADGEIPEPERLRRAVAAR